MQNLDKKTITGTAALLVHAAKIDEQYSDHEKKIIREFIKSYIKEDEINEILIKAEEIEQNSNQLLNYTDSNKKK